jgi:hypothetical protein
MIKTSPSRRAEKTLTPARLSSPKSTLTRGAGEKNKKDADDDFPEFSTIAEFMALSDVDKEKVALYYEQGRHRGETRPLNAGERAEVRREKKRMGRPRIGKGAKVISLSVERDLLQRADACAKSRGLKRAEFFGEALRGALSRTS